jgi:precorrin-2 dehydrogenase/sirohydrochlorin ferrochelatase
VVVVGGGPVGLRKARAAAAAGARVTLVDAQADPQALPGATVIPQPYRAEILAGAMLVFACTEDAALNRRIATDARRLGALVNAANQPDDCDFFLPAVWGDGDVTVAVGTGGLAPSLAVGLRDRLAGSLPKGLGRFAQAVAELRQTLRQRVGDAARRVEILHRLCEPQTLDAFLTEGPKALERRLDQLLGEG